MPVPLQLHGNGVAPPLTGLFVLAIFRTAVGGELTLVGLMLEHGERLQRDTEGLV